MNFIWCLNSTKFNWKDKWVSYGFFSTVCDIFTFSSSRHLSFSFSPVKKDIVSFVSREFSWFLGCHLLPHTKRLMFHLKLSGIRDGTVCSLSKKQTFLVDRYIRPYFSQLITSIRSTWKGLSEQVHLSRSIWTCPSEKVHLGRSIGAGPSGQVHVRRSIWAGPSEKVRLRRSIWAGPSGQI